MQGSKFNKAPADTFLKIQLGAGTFVSSFAPSTGVVGDPLFATDDSGANFNATPNFIDHADGIANIPRNTAELKDIDSWNVSISGNGRTIDTTVGKMFLAAADIDGTDTSKIVPRNYLKTADFDDLWWVGAVGRRTGTDVDYIAIHILRALSTGGFQLQTANADKGSFPFTFTGHYTISDTDAVPFEVYVKNTAT